MLFNSTEFLFVFLPVVLIVFVLLQRFQNPRLLMAWLVAASLFFYAWWNPVYLLLLLLSVSVNFSVGLMLARQTSTKRLWLLLGIVFNLGLLVWFKYANFFVDNISPWFDVGFNFENIILPLAISFYTFQQITYLVDTSKGLTESHDWLDYSLFVTFFPQLIAGPIVHHSDMLVQFKDLGRAADNTRNRVVGMSIFAIGLFKKVVIADGFALFATPVFDRAADAQPLFTMDALAGSFGYAFQLYFDFSGYSDMAIGLACMFLIKLPVNFFSPFRAQNISDFWRMWHATLSQFLRDYIYKPLGGFFVSSARQRFNLFVTMFIGGVWHGAGWTFVVFGICHGACLLMHQLWRGKVSGPAGLISSAYYRFAAQIITFVFVVMTLVLFRSESLAAATNVFASMFNFGGFTLLPEYVALLNSLDIVSLLMTAVSGLSAIILVFVLLGMALAFCWLMPSTYQLFKDQDVVLHKPMAGRNPVISIVWQPNAAWAATIAVLAAASLFSLSQPSEFLYFQF